MTTADVLNAIRGSLREKRPGQVGIVDCTPEGKVFVRYIERGEFAQEVHRLTTEEATRYCGSLEEQFKENGPPDHNI